VGLPYAFLHLGFPLALAMNVLVGFLTIYSCFLYLRAMENTGHQESFAEIGYRCFGRASVFLINVVVFANSFGLMMLYFIILGDISRSLIQDLFKPDDVFWQTRQVYVYFFALLLAVMIFQKEIKELKCASYVLFGSLLTFIAVFWF